MLGKIAKFVVKTGIKVGVGAVALKYVFTLGYEFGQAMQMTRLSVIQSREPQYVDDLLAYYKETYDTAEGVMDILENAVDFVKDSDTIDDVNFDKSLAAKSCRYVSRFFAYYMIDNYDIKFKEIILPHQDYLYRLSKHNPNMPCMVLELRNPESFGYNFKFDRSIMYQIAFDHNVLYNYNNLSFVGPMENINKIGQNFWTDYNLIAMDQGLPCIDMDHYTADKFKAN